MTIASWVLVAPLLVLPAGAPASATMASPSSDLVREAAHLLARTYPDDSPGAAVLVARGDTVLVRHARGLADLDRRIPMAPDAVFHIASAAKQFTAAGLLTLVDAGRVSLDDPLSKYVPDFPGGDGIAVAQLLNHTAGVKEYTSLRGYLGGPITSELTTAQMIDVFRHAPRDFPPGTKWSYSNSGYVLAGAVIEAVTGMAWHAYLDRALFKPLGMRHTGYAGDARWRARQVRGYTADSGRFVPGREISMSQVHASGALVSNLDDLLRWNRALHEGRVLEPATYARMITPVGPAAEVGYGFGLYTVKVRRADGLRHGGAIFGFIASLLYLPGSDITVAVLESDDANGAADDAETLSRRLAALALGDPYPDATPVPVGPAALAEAEGVYRFPGDVRRVLRVMDGRLTAQRDGRPRAGLVPIGRDSFLYEDGFNRLELVREADGRISGMRHFAGGDGDGAVGTRTDEPLPGAPVGLRLPRAALERLVGTYADGRFTLKITLEGEALRAQLAGQPALALRATSPTEFAVEDTGATLEFPPGDAPAAQVRIRQNGRELALDRTP
jgi:CubicO group peptidase (beta-lactamase class C family)